MTYLIAILIGGLFTASVYLLLHNSFFKIIVGIILFSNAANLFLIAVSSITRGAPALISESHSVNESAMADPTPQALILTAIVIGFGLQAFLIVLFKSVYESLKTDNLNTLNDADNIDKKIYD